MMDKHTPKLMNRLNHRLKTVLFWNHQKRKCSPKNNL